MTERGVSLVYGGGAIGLMGTIADEVLAHGGEVTGVIPQRLEKKGVVHEALTELQVVDTMHERKARMAESADAFIALPGGFGTLEELFEVIAWAQLGIHAKPVGLLDVEGFYAPLVRLVDHAVDEGFIRPTHRALVIAESHPEALLDRLAHYRPPPPILEVMGIA